MTRISGNDLSRTMFAGVNYSSSALVKENLSYFPFTRPWKIGSVYSRHVFLEKWGCCRVRGGLTASLN